MKRKTQRIPATARRRQILTIAADLFARQGFRGTTTKQIAARAQVNEAIVFRHFPTKEDLYWAVLEEKCESSPSQQFLEEAFAAGDDDRTVFTALATGLMERTMADPTLMRLLLFSALEAHELSKRFSRTYMTGFYETLAGHIRRRMRQGVFRSTDPLLASRAFLGMMFQYLLATEMFGAPRVADHHEVAETFTDLWLNGMRNPKRKQS